MQHVKNAIGGNAMTMLKMHQNALKCTRMRMGKINTTFGKKQHLSRRGAAARATPVRLLLGHGRPGPLLRRERGAGGRKGGVNERVARSGTRAARRRRRLHLGHRKR